MTRLTNSLVPLVMVWCYEGGLGFCAKKASTLLEYQFNVCMAQSAQRTYFSGNYFNSFKLQAKQLDISDVVDCRLMQTSQPRFEDLPVVMIGPSQFICMYFFL